MYSLTKDCSSCGAGGVVQPQMFLLKLKCLNGVEFAVLLTLPAAKTDGIGICQYQGYFRGWDALPLFDGYSFPSMYMPGFKMVLHVKHCVEWYENLVPIPFSKYSFPTALLLTNTTPTLPLSSPLTQPRFPITG